MIHGTFAVEFFSSINDLKYHISFVPLSFTPLNFRSVVIKILGKASEYILRQKETTHYINMALKIYTHITT